METERIILSKQFKSSRLKRIVVVVITFEFVRYIFPVDLIPEIVITRPNGFHLNNDGLDRCIDLFEDFRFDYWYSSIDDELFKKKVGLFIDIRKKSRRELKL